MAKTPILLRSGAWGWAGMATLIASYDILAYRKHGETMSSAFRRSLQHPVRRWPVIIAWALVTKHLFLGKFFPQIDPLWWIGKLIINTEDPPPEGRAF